MPPSLVRSSRVVGATVVTTENARSAGTDLLLRRLTASLDEPGARKDEILETASRLFAETGLRTSLQDIADACGIRPGSLYHHFDSKEALVVELIERYHAELDQLAANAAKELADCDASAAPEMVVALGIAIAQTGARHSAAVQFSFYEPPAGSDAELLRLANQRPSSVMAVMTDTLRLASTAGLVRSTVDVDLAAERIVSTMLYTATGLFEDHPVDRVAAVLCDVLLSGIAVDVPSNSALDRSEAMKAVREVIRTWEEPDADLDDRAARIHAAARTEFGRRGYEVTTVRQIAATAGVSTGAVYRVIGSKEELLAAITTSFMKKVMTGWNAALGSESTASEKIDALTWMQINVVERFSDEFKIELAWLRQSPPETAMFTWSFHAAARGLRTMLREGVKAGQLRSMNVSGDLMARCLLALTWMPEGSLRTRATGQGTAPSTGDLNRTLALGRDTVLRGALTR